MTKERAMRRMTMMAALLAACSSGARSNGAGEGTATGAGVPATPAAGKQQPANPVKATDGDKPEGKDIKDDVLEMNSDKYARPPVKFRKGHVTKRKAPAFKKTKTGFEIKFPAGAPITTPAVYDGKVFVSGGFNSKQFFAFDSDTGKSVWARNLDDDGPSTAACSENICVFNTESCTVFALDADTGTMKWSWWLGDPLTSAPTIADGLVFTSYPASGKAGKGPRPPGASHALIAFDLQTGEIKWQMWLDSDVMSAPVASGKFVYINTFSGSLMKLEQKTGKVRYAIKARATSAPVVQFRNGRETMFYTRRGVADDDEAEEMIIRADDNDPKTTYATKKKKAKYLDKKVQSKSKFSGKSLEADSKNGFGAGAPASAKGEVAFSSIGQKTVSGMQQFQGSRILNIGDRNINTMGDEVVATSAKSGDTLWSFKLDGNLEKSGGFLGTAPLAAGNRVLFATLAGDVITLDPESGKVKKKYKVGSPIRSQPVVSDGWIYVGTQDGRLIAINTGNKKLTGWAMWGGNAARTGIRVAKK